MHVHGFEFVGEQLSGGGGDGGLGAQPFGMFSQGSPPMGAGMNGIIHGIGRIQGRTGAHHGGGTNKAVATGLIGSHYHRNHRAPGTHPVAPGQTSPGPAPAGGVGGPRSMAAG